MNILFFLSPKQDLMYVYDDFTLRQTLEKWENNRYASIPVLNRKGEYVGTLTEGDILWGLKPELCARGGRPGHLYRHRAAAGHHPLLLRQGPHRGPEGPERPGCLPQGQPCGGRLNFTPCQRPPY